MSLEDDTNNLSELTPISSNHRVQKTIQNSTITTVDSSSSISLKTFIEQQVAMFSNIDKFTDTLCDQLKNLTSTVKHNVNVEQTSRGSSSTISQERSLVVKNRHKETRKRHHDEVSFSEDSVDSDDNDTPNHKSLRVNPITAVCSHQQHHRDDDKVSIADEEKGQKEKKIKKEKEFKSPPMEI